MSITKEKINKWTNKGKAKKLIKVFRKPNEDYDIRKHAAISLGKIGKPFLEHLIEALRDDNKNVKKSTVEALGEIKDTRAIDPLITLLNDGDRDVRIYTAKTLGKIGDPKSVEPLIRALEEEKWGKDTIAAAEALGEIGDSRAVDALITKLSFKDEVEEEQRNRFLRGEIPGFWGSSHILRATAATALGKISDKRAVEPLVNTLDDREIAPREAAKEALIMIGDDRTVGFVISLLTKYDSITYIVASEVLLKFGDSAIKSLIAALKKSIKIEGERMYSGNLINALRLIKDPRAVDPIIKVLKNVKENERERIYAVEALGEIGDHRAVGSLIKALKDKNWKVRMYIIEALGKIGDPRAIDPIIAHLSDEIVDVKEKAAVTLAKMYHKGELDKKSKERIYAERSRIRYEFQKLIK